MNIHPSSTESPSAPAEWTTEFLFDLVGRTYQWTSVISRSGLEVCRLSAASGDGNREAAKVVAAEKSRAWIASFLRR